MSATPKSNLFERYKALLAERAGTRPQSLPASPGGASAGAGRDGSIFLSWNPETYTLESSVSEEDAENLQQIRAVTTIDTHETEKTQEDEYRPYGDKIPNEHEPEIVDGTVYIDIQSGAENARQDGAYQLLCDFRQRGIRVWQDGERLAVSPASLVMQADLEEITPRLAAIVALFPFVLSDEEARASGERMRIEGQKWLAENMKRRPSPAFGRAGKPPKDVTEVESNELQELLGLGWPLERAENILHTVDSASAIFTERNAEYMIYECPSRKRYKSYRTGSAERVYDS
jgi:hypothetical protein